MDVPAVWRDATCVHVVDGDTMDCVFTLDIGFADKVVRRRRVRLNRINTPPAHTIEGMAATAYVIAWVENRVLEVTTLKPYKYGGEWMAEVVCDGVNLSDLLVEEKLARLWDGKGPRPGGVRY